MQTFVHFHNQTMALTEASLASALQAIREQKIIALETKLKRMRNLDNRMKVRQEIRNLKQLPE